MLGPAGRNKKTAGATKKPPGAKTAATAGRKNGG
jgi:hypothetical protein